MITIAEKPQDFDAWQELLELLRMSYAYMDGRIDPPSSLHRLDAASLAEKSEQETLLLAWDGETLAGCCFLREANESFYIGKLAVDPRRQGLGIGRRLLTYTADLARQKGRSALELETRIELVENHRAFAALGFRKTGESTHPGYSRSTSITMRRELSGNEVV